MLLGSSGMFDAKSMRRNAGDVDVVSVDVGVSGVC